MGELKCRICGNTLQNQTIMLHGTMYGTHGEFPYFRCGQCGCLQICGEVEDIGQYYNSDDYYSFNMDRRKWKNRLLYAQLKNQVVCFDPMGALVELLYPVNYRFLKLVGRGDAILDVGCGDGELLRWMQKAGFRNVKGIDPYLDHEIVQDGKTLVMKGDAATYPFEQSYRMITMIHSLEHVYRQQEMVQALDRILEPGGFLVFQLPVLSGYYWKKYGTNLYTLDPPRHFYLHTRESLMRLMERFPYRLVGYSTEIDVAIPKMAENAAMGKTEKNSGTGFISGTLASLFSLKLRKKLREEGDGAIATAVFRKAVDKIV